MACKERRNTVLLDTTHGLQREKKYSITKHNPWPAKREEIQYYYTQPMACKERRNTVLLEHNPWPAKREEIQYY